MLSLNIFSKRGRWTTFFSIAFSPISNLTSSSKMPTLQDPPSLDNIPRSSDLGRLQRNTSKVAKMDMGTCLTETRGCSRSNTSNEEYRWRRQQRDIFHGDLLSGKILHTNRNPMILNILCDSWRLQNYQNISYSSEMELKGMTDKVMLKLNALFTFKSS